MKSFSIKSVKFKRTKESHYELGIMLGNDKIIIDLNHKPVEVPIWTWYPTNHIVINVDISDYILDRDG